MKEELNISLPGAPVASDSAVITIQVKEGGSYSIVEEALFRFTGWFTVTAIRLCRAVIRTVRRYVRRAFRLGRRAILRQSSILRI